MGDGMHCRGKTTPCPWEMMRFITQRSWDLHVTSLSSEFMCHAIMNHSRWGLGVLSWLQAWTVDLKDSPWGLCLMNGLGLDWCLVVSKKQRASLILHRHNTRKQMGDWWWDYFLPAILAAIHSVIEPHPCVWTHTCFRIEDSVPWLACVKMSACVLL